MDHNIVNAPLKNQDLFQGIFNKQEQSHEQQDDRKVEEPVAPVVGFLD